MNLKSCLIALLLLEIGLGAVTGAEEAIWLDSLDLKTMKQGWGKPQVNKSVTGKPLSIAGKSFERGVGTHAMGSFVIDLAKGSDRFQASVGVDGDVLGPNTLTF